MKASKDEEMHVWEHELKGRLEVRAAEVSATAVKGKDRLKDLHWMNYPKCGQKLATERHGLVEVDLCPSCHGLWLDVDELETIVASEGGMLRPCLKMLRGG